MDQMLQTLDPDAQAQWEAEQRKRLIAQAMMKQFLGGTQIQQPNTPIMAKLSPLAALAPVLGSYLANKRDAEGATNQASILKNSMAQTSEGLQKLYTGMAPGAMGPGMPEQPATPFGSRDAPQQDAQPAQPPQPVDQRALLAQYLSSQNPMLRAAAANLQKQQADTAATGAKIMGDFGDVQGAVSALNNGRLPQGYQPTPVKPAQIENIPGANGPIPIARQFNRKGEETIHGLGGQQINVGNQVQKAGLEALMQAAVADSTDAGKQAQGAIRLKSTLAQLAALDEKGVISGPATNPVQWLTSLAQSAGFPVDTAKLANSQNYASYAQQAVQNLISQNGGNAKLTESETKLIQSIIPQLQQSPEARAQLTQILAAGADRKVQDYLQSRKDLADAIDTQDPKRYTFAGVSAGTQPPVIPGASSVLPSTPPGKPPVSGNPPAGSGIVTPKDEEGVKQLIGTLPKEEVLALIKKEPNPSIRAQMTAAYEARYGKLTPSAPAAGWRIVN